jgi:Gluconate 2-dehydrogenase subunit 3
MESRREPQDKKNSVFEQLQPMSRRDVLAGTAATIACAIVPAASLRFAHPPVSREILTATERQTLEAVVSRIIPAGSDGPGALEAGCARYIESSLGDAYQTLRKPYAAGLAALNSRAMSVAGKSFAASSADEQDKILSDFEHNTKIGDYSESASFFETVRRHTLEGMFGDPSYGGNANFAGWDLIGYPGARMYASPEMQNLDAKIPRSRKSAKQLVHASD